MYCKAHVVSKMCSHFHLSSHHDTRSWYGRAVGLPASTDLVPGPLVAGLDLLVDLRKVKSVPDEMSLRFGQSSWCNNLDSERKLARLLQQQL